MNKTTIITGIGVIVSIVVGLRSLLSRSSPRG